MMMGWRTHHTIFPNLLLYYINIIHSHQYNNITTMTHSSILIATIVILSVIQLSTSFIPSTQSQLLSTSQPSTSAIYAKKKGRQTNVPKPLPTGPPPQDIKWVSILHHVYCVNCTVLYFICNERVAESTMALRRSTHQNIINSLYRFNTLYYGRNNDDFLD